MGGCAERYESSAGATHECHDRAGPGELPTDERLANLVDAIRLVMTERGWLDGEQLEMLEGRGVDRRQLYEIISIVTLKTISNYVNHIAHTEVDSEFGS